MNGRYQRIARMIASDRCVILDGAIGTELLDVSGARPEVDEHLWGITAIVADPGRVKAVHRRYVDAGCDVISTDTWGLPTAVREGRTEFGDRSRRVHWMDAARVGVRLARSAVDEGGRTDECAVGFSLNGDIDTPEGQETIRLLGRAFDDDPPDLVLVETLSLVRASTYATVERLLDIGCPVWLSFRRCRHGLCGVYGEHWGGPEGDAFGRSARRFEEIGVGALLINCVPPDHVPGTLSWLRDFTDLPLGVYPNLGYLSSGGWRSETAVGGREYAELAASWRGEGAQIVGGCCGVGPEHIVAARTALAGTKPGNRRAVELPAEGGQAPRPNADRPTPWTDARGRSLFPLDLPDIAIDDGVVVPSRGSFLLWKHLFLEGVGAHQRCLDIGCGTGLQAIQLARNGAAHVHAIDEDGGAVAQTLTNAFRNGVADRISGAAVDLLPWVPSERYDVIVACLQQVPVDPFEQVSTHRRRDYWGRNLVDHLISLLPEALADDGVALLVHMSIIGWQRTAERLDALGFRSRVVDFGLVEPQDQLAESAEQIDRVEALSDAYRVRLGDREAPVAYVLEVTPGPAR